MINPVRSLGALLFGAALLVAGCSTPRTLAVNDGKAAIDYRVSIPDIAAETFVVDGTLRNITGDTITYHFPIWGPGAYDIVDFGSYVTAFSATGEDGQNLRVIRSDTNTFKIIGGGRLVSLKYKVHDIEYNPKSLWFGLSDIEQNYAFANTPAIFGYPDGFKQVPSNVTYVVPSSWDIAIGLDPTTGEPHTYHARDYDELVDAPLEMGKFQRYEVSINGKPHVITLSAPEEIDSERANQVVRTTDTIVRIVSGFFGDMPYDRYVFQHYLTTPSAGDMYYGALEHRNSSTYRMPYSRGRSLAEDLASVIAHEYFHVWSPKRIHVSQLGPFDYQAAPRTKSLWFAEGLTEYYAKVLLLRNHMSERNELLEQIEQMMNAARGKPQRKSITEVSHDISTADQAENLALYSKGPVLGLFLDTEIRMQTGNRKSLDDAMRYFNERYGRTGRTFGDDDIIPIMEEATGAKLADFYRHYIDGRDPLPYDTYLPKLGIAYDSTTEERAELGGELGDDPNGWSVVSVAPGGSADSTGLKPGDVISALRVGPTRLKVLDLKVPAQAVNSFIGQFPPGAELDVLRNGSTVTLKLVLVSRSVPVVRLGIDATATGEALAMRRAIFGV